MDTKPLIINNINKSIIIYKNNFSLLTYSDPKICIPYTTHNYTNYNKVFWVSKLLITSMLNYIISTSTLNTSTLNYILNISTLNYIINTTFSHTNILHTNMYTWMGIQIYGFIHNLKLFIEKFNNYRVTKYSNDTKLGTFFKIFIYII